MLGEMAKIQASRLQEIGKRLNDGQPTSPVPGAVEHEKLIHDYALAMYGWGVSHAQAELAKIAARLTRRQRFADPPKPKGPPPVQAILWAQSRAGLQGKWERDLDAKVQEVISQSLAEGVNQREIMKRLAKVFPAFGKARLENIARTETASAYNAGRLATLKQSALVAAVQFTAIVDDRTTEICQTRDGRIILINNPDLLANTPPLHFQCRSTIVPVDKYDMEDLAAGDKALEESYFGWLTAPGHPRTLAEAQDWQHLPQPLRGFGGASMPSTPVKAPTTTSAPPIPVAPKVDPVVMLKADLELQLNMGKALEFEVGHPPTWEHLADQVGFPAGPKPETKMGAGDSQLPVSHWKTFYPHQLIFEDPAKKLGVTGKSQSAGVIMVEDAGVWLVEPTNHFGGYVHTFPKGGVQAGLNHQQSALKELWEETGMQGELLAYLGEYEKTTSQTKLYIGKKVSGQPWHAGWESQKVKLVPWDKLDEFLDMSTSSGKKADLQAAKDLKELLAKVWPPGADLHKSLSDHNLKQALNHMATHVPTVKTVPGASPLFSPVAPPPAPVVTKKPRKPRAKKLPKVAPAIAPQDWDTAWDMAPRSDWGTQGSPKGSNPGGMATHRDGSKWYLKQPKTSDHARNEHLAAQLYRLAGAEMPEIRLVDSGTGKVGLASRIIEGLSNSPAALLNPATNGVGEYFAADAWLGNWDVVGATYDNLLALGDRAVRIDVGGSLLYRAQGDPKGSAWNNDASEWFSLRTMAGSTSANVFSGVPGEQLVASAQRVAAITPEQIAEAVKRSGFDAATSQALTETLIARRQAIVDHASKYQALAGRGPWDNASSFVSKLKGSNGHTNLHNQQKLRNSEMSALIGKSATDAYADLWYDGWQSSSNSTGAKILREEWELLQKQQAPKRPEIRAALLAQQVTLRNTFSVDKLTLHRGFTWDRVEDEIVAAAALGKTKARVPSWQITSWAADKHAAFSGVKVKLEVDLKDIVGGTGLSPGFNKNGKFSDENELVVAADEIDGTTSWFHLPLADTQSSKWGPGRKHANPQEYAEYLRTHEPAKLDRILKDYGANQTLSKKKKVAETFAQTESFHSEGMMQGPQLDAEARSLQDHYAAKQAKIAQEAGEGKIATIGKGLAPEEIWGEGPFGRR